MNAIETSKDEPCCFDDAVRNAWKLSRDELMAQQVIFFNQQIDAIFATNQFYRRKFGDKPRLKHLQDLEQLPFTTKQELVDSQEALGISSHHSYSSRSYSRIHRTSGTRGVPLIVMDTQRDWNWWSDTWQHVLTATGISEFDRVFLAFSFGPFVGFWSAHEACARRGTMVIPGGGLSSLARIEFMRQSKPTVLACTPTYAIQLASAAEQSGVDPRTLGIRRVIVAGEPGGSIPAVRARIADAWDAQVVDHCGATEIGPWGFGWPECIGLQIIETSFIAELVPPLGQTSDSDLSELVLTSLGRYGAPVIRYRTGDLVRATVPEEGVCRFMWLPDGIVGRADDMVIVRGVNVFPSSIDALVRKFDGIQEYRVTLTRRGALDELVLEVEATNELAQKVAEQCELQMGMRIPIRTVPIGSLPRTEAKAKRWIDLRDSRA